MKSTWGGTQLGEVNGTKIAPVRELVRSKAGVGVTFKWRYTIECAMKVSGQADCKNKMDAVEAALATPNQDLLFLNDDGSNSTNSVLTANTIGGQVVCTQLSWDPQPGGQFMTWRNFSATFEWETFLTTGTPIAGATWSSGTATITTGSPHGIATGQTVLIYGVNPLGYNGSYAVTVTDATHFTFALAINPGAFVAGGMAFRSTLLVDFEETVTIDNPPSRFVVTEAVNGVAAVARITVALPKSTAVQFGFAVGLTGYPDLSVVAPPLFNSTPPLKSQPFTKRNPVKVGPSGNKEYRLEWRYEYESPTALAALPPHTW